jgi:hypothetical protein
MHSFHGFPPVEISSALSNFPLGQIEHVGEVVVGTIHSSAQFSLDKTGFAGATVI